jgi:hypothetical protein
MFTNEVTLPNLSIKISSIFLQALAVSGGEILTTYAENNGFQDKPSKWMMTFRISFSSAFRMEKFVKMCTASLIEIEDIGDAGGNY